MASIADYLDRKANVLRTSGPNVFIECPGCGTRKAKCSVNVRKGIGNCFRASCPLNGGFTFPTLICKIEAVQYSEALSIAARFSDEVERDYKAKSFGTNRDYPANALPLQELINRSEFMREKSLYFLAEHATHYLVDKRGLTFEQISDYQLGAGWQDIETPEGIVPRKGMIVIPVFFNGEIVSYAQRSIEVFGAMLASQKHHKPTESENYLMSGQILFNCDVAIPLARKRGYLIIVEDVWSAIKLGAVATLGSNLSDDQLFILVNNWSGPVVICRDNDEGGREAALKDIVKLSRHYQDVRNVEPVGCDPDDNLPATMQLIQTSRPIDLFQHQLRLSLQR